MAMYLAAQLHAAICLSGRPKGTRIVKGVYMSERSALHAYLSYESHEAWATFSEENGCSVTSLLEALGLELKDELDTTPADDLRQAWVKRARRIDAERRRRGGINQR